MAKFFVKPAKPAQSTGIQQSAVAGPSRIQTDYEKTFKPFALQKDKTLAPTNWFQADKKRKQRIVSQTTNQRNIIVVDSDEEFSDIEMLEPQPTEAELISMSSQGLHHYLSELKRS